MTQRKIRAVYMRGGTSRCLVFREEDLPHPGPARDRILLSALGSPDPYGRQLDGLGGGISSLSKACIVGAPTHPDADVDYTFAQVDVKSPVVEYHGNCGNCSSAIGPFAIDEGLVRAQEGETVVRVHNTNTKKLIVVHVPTRDGVRHVADDYDVLARAISMGNCHRAFPLTSAMCLAVAARIEGTLVHDVARTHAGDVRLGHASGVLPLDAAVTTRDGAAWAERVTVYRTARRLMEGFVRIP